MQRFFLRKLATFIFIIIGTIYAYADEPVPGWLAEAGRRPTPEYEIKDVPAVVLHDEQTVTLNADGKLTIVTSHAIRVLTDAGKEEAIAIVPYLQSASKVREFKAWLIPQKGTTKFFDSRYVIDQISDPDDIYNESRIKIIDASDDSSIGGIFGYQSIVEERPIFTQDIWAFQRDLPTLLSRYQLNVPSGWQATSITFNHDEIKPRVLGGSFTWELHDLKPIPPESSSPSFRNLAPFIAVNYFPTTPNGTRIFNKWEDVSRWTLELHDPQVTIDDSVANKARELTANATNELEKIRAIANFVQNMRYISIDIGIASGNGYKPRPANLVLQRGFGDCKDKANLMRALLRALKIESYPVIIFSGDPTFVREEWVSPAQFNHCIIAIRVSDSTRVASMISHPTLGNLLIFDATDPYTLLGDLPDHEQGSLALVATGNDGKLMRMPVTPAEMNRLERNAEVALDSVGNISGRISETANGQTATAFRGEFRELSLADYQRRIETWVARGMSGAKATKISPKDNLTSGKFDLDVEFTARAYAQLMQNRLMVFKPAIVGRLDRYAISNQARINPYLIDSFSYVESVKIILPQGFVVDEMPETTKIESSFGKYNVSFSTSGGNLILNRALTLNKATIHPRAFDEVRKFFASVRTAEQSQVVLIRQ